VANVRFSKVIVFSPAFWHTRKKIKNGGNVKRIIGLAVGCLLGGCDGQDGRYQSTLTIQNPMLQARNVRQDTAPLPWVHVLPSERAAHFLDADFDYLARRIRHAMTINLERFKGVCLVLVDYAILDAKPTKTKPMTKKYKGQTYCKEYITKPERYFMRISFYGNNQAPPAPPLFVGAAVLSVRHAAPFEAMHFLLDDIILERLKLPLTQIEVNLDAAEDIEKNLVAVGTSTETSTTHKISSHHETPSLRQKTSASPKKIPAPSPETPPETPAAAPPSAPAVVPAPSPETPSGTAPAAPPPGAPVAVPAPSPETPSGTAPAAPPPGTPAPAPAPSPETPSGTPPAIPPPGASAPVPAPSLGTSASPSGTTPAIPPPGTPAPVPAPSSGTPAAAPTGTPA